MGQPEPEGVYRGRLDKLMRRVRDARGLDLSKYRPTYVERRLGARLRMLDLHTYRQYAAYLDEHPEEYDRLLDVLTINVTDFFRDAIVYETVRRTVVPALVKEKARTRQRMIRIWSAGCATGEEAYSITMTFLSALGPQADDFLLTVLATDIDPQALAIAEKAEYDVARLGHVPRQDRLRWFDISGTTATVRPEVTRHVRFRRLDLFDERPLNVVDLIFCRNVFIYFNRQQQEMVLERFLAALHRGGYLVMGRSEKVSPALAGKFELVSSRDRIYRRPSL